jgi:hypothetical protein
MKFAAGVGEMGFADFGDNDAAALGADVKTAEIGGGATQGVIGGVETLLKARMGWTVEAVRAEEQEEIAESLDGVGEKRVERARAIAAQRAGVVRRRTRRGGLDGPVIEES